MDIDLIQVSVLAVIQGVTEFLPISSSGHLILPAELLGWQDQGLVFDVAVHLGSLLAVAAYFRRDLLELLVGWLGSIRTRKSTEESNLAWLLILATLPAGLAGLLVNDLVEQYARSMLLVASTSILFAILLWLADDRKKGQNDLRSLDWKKVLVIGLAQVLALIPGTSRSGVTMTAGLFMNLSRQAASRFSFLMAIPIIGASGLLKTLDFYRLDTSAGDWFVLLYAALLSGAVSFLCIHYFLGFIQRTGFLPFVIYRIMLGGFLFYLYAI